MQAYARRTECKHIVWAGPLVDTTATLHVADDLRGRSCPTCGETVDHVDFVLVRKPGSAPFDGAPAPRNTENKLKKASKSDVQRTRTQLRALGAETDGLAADLRKAALGLTPSEWGGALAKIPVGILATYEPNAECIRFKGSVTPAIVFHQGLAGYLFKMNRSVFPLLRMGSLGSAPVTEFVKEEKVRSALRVQAVDTALEFLGVGRPRSKTLVEIPTIVRFMEMPLTRVMSAFVLCHEYGHAVLNHADELRAPGTGSTFYLLERSRAMEFEADTWGQDAVTGAYSGGKNLEPTLAVLDDLFGSDVSELKKDISLAAPCVTLMYFEFLDMVEERLARHGVAVAAQDALTRRRARTTEASTREPSTHPSNRERFRALYAHLSDHGNIGTHTWVESFERFLDEIKDDLDKLVDKTGAVETKRLRRRFRWPRSTAGRREGWQSDTITHIDDDKSARETLQEAFRNVEGESLKLDEAALWRHFEEQKKRAQKHYDKKEFAEAEKIYTNILNGGETIESVPLYPLLGVCRQNVGDQQGAIAAFRRCLELVPGSDPAAMSGFFLGQLLLYDRKDPDGAEGPLRAATSSHVPYIRATATFCLGTVAHNRGDIEGSLQRYRAVYALRDDHFDLPPPAIPLAALNIGIIMKERGHRAEAVEMLEYARDHPDLAPENRGVAEQHLREVRRR